MRPNTTCLMPILLLSLAGCGPSAPPPEKTVFDTQVQALERAREVEDVVLQRSDEIEKQLKPD